MTHINEMSETRSMCGRDVKGTMAENLEGKRPCFKAQVWTEDNIKIGIRERGLRV